MLRLPVKILISLCLVLVTCRTAFTATLQCTFNAAVTPTIRSEGVAEGLIEFFVDCTGGTPTASGNPVPAANLRVFFNANATPRLLSGVFTDALLLIDDPHSTGHPNIPMLPCGAASSNDNGSGVCSITADGTGQNTYDGSPGHANVFQGQMDGANAIVWTGIPIDPPGTAGHRILHFTGLRVNASQLPYLEFPASTQVVASLDVTPTNVLPLNNNQQTVAFVQRGQISTRGSVPTLSQCASANPGAAGDSSRALDSGGQNGQQFYVRFDEGSPNLWHEKNVQYHMSNAAIGAPFNMPPDSAQDAPGSGYFSESGFLVNGVAPAGATPPGFGPFLPPHPVFPAVRGLDTVGTATSGTRMYVKFTSIPAGMKLFAPVKIQTTIPANPSAAGGIAVLTSTALDGSGPFTAVTANASGLAPLTVSGGTAMAVYEIVYTDPFNLESLTVPVAAAFVADGQNLLAAGTVNVETGLAPFSTIAVAYANALIPRFVASGVTNPAFTIGACSLQDLKPTVAHAGLFAPGSSGSSFQVMVSNVGTQPSSGTVTVVASVGSGLTATAIAGSGWTCTVGNLTCSRSDAVAGGGVYPPIAVTVDVNSNAAGSLTVTSTVSGGGDTTSGNNTSSDTVSLAPLPITTVSATPAGAAFSVDGTVYTTPQSFHWSIGSSHTIAVNPSQTANSARYTFQTWSDGGDPSHTVTATVSAATYSALLSAEYQLTISSIAGNGSVTPASGQFYSAGTTVMLQAIPSAGFMFSQWLGPVSSATSSSTSIVMSAPRYVSAVFAPSEPFHLPQTITFEVLPNRTLGDAPFALSASSTSTLPVTFAIVSGPATLAGNMVTLTGTGTVAVRASQSGTSLFEAAPDVVRSFTVNPAPKRPTLTLTAMPTNAGSISTTPGPIAGAYDAGTSVQVFAKPNAGFVFTGFSGDLTGVVNPQTLIMSANRAVVANFAPVSTKNEDNLAFGAQGGGMPPSQTITLDDMQGPPSITVVTSSGGNWLRATLNSSAGSTKAHAAGAPTVTISVDPTAVHTLSCGEYSGYVTISTASSVRVVSAALLVDLVRIKQVADAASYTPGSIASGGLYSLFGVNLAQHTLLSGDTIPLVPDGTSLTVTDLNGVEIPVQLTFVSPGQLNFIAPDGIATGAVTLTVTNGAGQSQSFHAQATRVTPGLFSADMTGSGIAAATLLKVAADGSQTAGVAADCVSNPGRCLAIPIDLGADGDAVYLALYGTGIRGRSSMAGVRISAGDVPLEVLYAGIQGQYAGLDQINVRLPKVLAGRGELVLSMVVDGVSANSVRLQFR